jgi:hypothetical protein
VLAHLETHRPISGRQPQRGVADVGVSGERAWRAVHARELLHVPNAVVAVVLRHERAGKKPPLRVKVRPVLAGPRANVEKCAVAHHVDDGIRQRFVQEVVRGGPRRVGEVERTVGGARLVATIVAELMRVLDSREDRHR